MRSATTSMLRSGSASPPSPVARPIHLMASSVGLRPLATSPDAGGGSATRSLPSTTRTPVRSEEHTSELSSLMRNSYDHFCLIKKSKTSQSSTIDLLYNMKND